MPDHKPMLDYHTPERRPWLVIHWGGWLFLAVVIFALAGEWIFGRHPSPGSQQPVKMIQVQLPESTAQPTR